VSRGPIFEVAVFAAATLIVAGALHASLFLTFDVDLTLRKFIGIFLFAALLGVGNQRRQAPRSRSSRP
jgi:small basic protein